MASEKQMHPALVAGLSAGFGFAIPAVAYIATTPFDAAHAFVGAVALPFAVGSLAGVGLHVVSDHVVRSHAAQIEEATDQAAAAARLRAEAARDARREGVPVIARAEDALSEEEAWADIDSLLESDRSVSCDPVASKDIYQIALEEMARASRTPAQETPQPSQPAPTVPDTTETFMALASGRLGVSTMDEAAVTGVIPMDDLEEPSESIEVPMADYSGHEAMWAQALEILNEDKDEAAPAAPATDPFAYNPDLDTTAVVFSARSEAVAEGKRATKMHTHVNDMLKEELDSSSSQAVRSQGREYLRVIQGGTLSMPRLSAEA